MNRKLQIMESLLEATRVGVLQWQEVNSRTYKAVVDGNRFLITFKYPLLAMDDGSDADIAEVHVPGVALTFYNGTEGFDLVLQTLAACLPERAATSEAWANRADETLALLHRLIRESGRGRG